MAYLIDTNIIIYSIKGYKIVQDNFIKNENVPKMISVITYGELLFGAKKSKNVEKNLAVIYRIKEIFPIINVDKAVIEPLLPALQLTLIVAVVALSAESG